MRARRFLFAGLGALGLALYLWPALAAPLVLGADSEVDLKWSRQGIGLWQPLTPEEIRRAGIHTLKPGYILFLRGASMLRPLVGETRSIVLVQSLILWLAIAATSVVFARRRGAAAGVALYVVLLLFLPLRNSASAVMSEAISAALFLPLMAAALFPPRPEKGSWILGLGLAVLFAIRPRAARAANRRPVRTYPTTTVARRRSTKNEPSDFVADARKAEKPRRARSGDVPLLMSSGALGGLPETLLDAL